MRLHTASRVGNTSRRNAVVARLTLTTKILLPWLAVIFLASVQPSLAETEEAPVSSLVTVPATIKLARFDRSAMAEIVIIARATGVSPLPTNLDLSFTASPGLKVDIGERVKRPGDIVWPAQVSVRGDPPDAGIVDFRLAYSVAPNGAGGGSRSAGVQVQRASLNVQIEPGRDASPADDADVSIKTDSTEISKDKLIEAYLQIKNKSNQPFAVKTLDIANPEFLKVECPSVKSIEVAANGTPNNSSAVEKPDSTKAESCASLMPTVVAAHDALRVSLVISVSSGKRAPIGEWLILTNVELTRGEPPHERHGVAIAEQKVRVGVPGISEVLTLLGLPTLLLMPGALMLAMWALVLGANEAQKRSWLKWQSMPFWVVSITLSIVTFAVQTWRGKGANFLVAYNVGDVALLWFESIILGAGLGLFDRLGVWAWERFWAMRAERERRAEEPLETDSPIYILQKLLRQQLPIYLSHYQKLPNGYQQEIFMTGFKAPEGKAWFVPKMVCSKVSPNEPSATGLMSTIASANDSASKQPSTLVKLLEQGLEKKTIALDWERKALLGPKLMSSDKFEASVGKKSPLSLL